MWLEIGFLRHVCALIGIKLDAWTHDLIPPRWRVTSAKANRKGRRQRGMHLICTISKVCIKFRLEKIVRLFMLLSGAWLQCYCDVLGQLGLCKPTERIHITTYINKLHNYSCKKSYPVRPLSISSFHVYLLSHCSSPGRRCWATHRVKWEEQCL